MGPLWSHTRQAPSRRKSIAAASLEEKLTKAEEWQRHDTDTQSKRSRRFRNKVLDRAMGWNCCVIQSHLQVGWCGATHVGLLRAAMPNELRQAKAGAMPQTAASLKEKLTEADDSIRAKYIHKSRGCEKPKPESRQKPQSQKATCRSRTGNAEDAKRQTERNCECRGCEMKSHKSHKSKNAEKPPTLKNKTKS